MMSSLTDQVSSHRKQVCVCVLQNRCVFADCNQEAVIQTVNVQECVFKRMCVEYSGRYVKSLSRLETGSKIPAAAANPHPAFDFGYSNQIGSNGTNLSEKIKRRVRNTGCTIVKFINNTC